MEPNFSTTELPSDLLYVFSSPLTASWWLRSTRLYTCVTLNTSPDHLHSEAAFRQTLALHEKTQPPHSFQWDGCAGTAGLWPHHPTRAALAQHTRTFPGTSLCNLNRVIRLLTSQGRRRITWRKNSSTLCYKPSSSRDGNLTESHGLLSVLEFLNLASKLIVSINRRRRSSDFRLLIQSAVCQTIDDF